MRWTFVLLTVTATACSSAGQDESRTSSDTSNGATPNISIEAVPEDSVIVEQRLAWAREQRLDTLPIGAAIAAFGRTFVGAPYIPGSLEVEGPERLVVNLRSFDCVTFIENMIALARTIRSGGHYPEFTRELLRIRYRDGKLAGYPSRLHYFSEWISNNDAKGIVQNITQSIGGQRDAEPITFMTGHRGSYRQLADDTIFGEIGVMEQRLSNEPRYVIPETAIAQHAADIRDGDVIAAASNLPGLDIAHTGIALWVNGKLHLMHAPLVGKVVEISAVPLADRILDIKAQDGIMVARAQ
ncbi:MAG: N-acetylmuramoyl-L-alanine amidase-like domain-containing protein [Gemmatimonadota bacterium]